MQKDSLLPDKNETNKHVYAYLGISRQIDRDVINKFIDNKNLYEDKRYNCVFIGYDYDDKAKFGTLQGTNTSKVFHADLKGSNNSLGLFLKNNSDTLIVSDDIIDGMSLMSVMKAKGREIDSYSYLMLSDLDKSFEAVKYHLAHNNAIRNIVIAFKNDIFSRSAAEYITKSLTKADFTGHIQEYYPKNMSFNEDLIYLNTYLKQQKRARNEKNEGTRKNNAGTSLGNGRTGEQNQRIGTGSAPDGQVRTRSTQIHSQPGQLSLFPTADIREPIQESFGERIPSSNTIENNHRETGSPRESGGYSGSSRESSYPQTDQTGSRQHRNEGNSSTADVKNFKDEHNPVSYGGAKTKYQNNVAVIKLLKTLEEENRLATHDEQIILSKYTGWGGIAQAFDKNNNQWGKEYGELKSLLTDAEYIAARASTPNAHYTQPIVIQAIYKGLKNIGYQGEGKILEPSMGIGNFFAQLPDSMDNAELYGVELDSLSGRIAKQLYPNADIQIKGFEETLFKNNFFDVAIGNIPFGSYEVNDSKYNQHRFLIHDYFFAKSLDKVKPNGLIAFVTSKGTLDKADASTRKYLAERAKLLAAVRLPNTAFKGIANTEVTTDILFFRKRERAIVCDPDWVHLGLTEDDVPVNQYFVDHPEMLLGKMVFDRSMYGNEKDTALVNEADSFDLEKALQDAISNISAEAIDTTKEIYSTNDINEIPADPQVKNFTYTLINGELYYRENEVMVKCNFTGSKLAKIKLLHQVRNALRNVIDIQLQPNYNDVDLNNALTELNYKYDSFVSLYGYINHKNNQTVFEDDLDNPLLLSIENKTGDTEYSKTDIFRKATIKPKESFKIESAQDALIVSLNQYSCVNIPYMAQMYDHSEEDVIRELGNMIFLNPALYNPDTPYEGYETAEEYLSGDVKAKYAYVKRLQNDLFKGNIEALEKVQPEDLKIYDIGYKLGSGWIPLEMYHDFMFDTLETPWYQRNNIKITYNKINTSYTIYNKGADSSNILVHTKFGTSRRNAYQIIEDTLNFKASNVYDVIKDGENRDKRVLNPKETQIARAKQELLKNEFINWILKDENRVAELEKIYNDNFNIYVPRIYDGNNLIVPSMSDNFSLRKHQKDAAMRILLGGNTLLAHEVGAGKTFTMATGAMLLKQAGVAKKPLFVVPNHLIRQWGTEFLSLYPTANILVPTEKDFKKENRQKFIAKIATGNYDAVILSFTQFEKISMSPEYIQDQIRKDIEEITEAIEEIRQSKDGQSFSVKQYETMKKQLEVKLSKMIDEGKKDKVLTFEQLGVDYLFVDEAHYYKNCFVHTKMTNVAGISNTNAQKSFDMLLKTRYLTNKNKGRGIVFATGTPVTNSISEMYVMQRYLQEDTLKNANINHFDQWASVFGEVTTSLELAPTGNSFRMKTRFSKFYNMPELLRMFNQTADMKSIDDLDIIRPDIVGGKAETIVVKPSEYVKDYMKQLQERAEKISNGSVDPSEDNMLKITMEGKGVAIDPRLVDPDAEVYKDSKIYACCDKVTELYKKYEEDKALQLIFLDYGIQLYEVIKQELIEQGVKENEIAFISNAKNDRQKAALFEKCRNGKIRVLLGSTAKMGSGTNVQHRLISISHLDCPWRPADIEQRNGRARRQGNMYKEVHLFHYVTEGTFDSYLWQLQEKKQTFISQIMKNNMSIRNYDDLDQAALECSEVKALCCGDPRIKEKADIDNDVQRLQIEKNAYLRERENLKRIIEANPRIIEETTINIENIKHDIQLLQKNETEEDSFEIEFMGVTYIERKDAAEVLHECIKTCPIGVPKEVGKYKGLDIIVKKGTYSTDIILSGAYKTIVELGSSSLGNIMRIENVPSTYAGILERRIHNKANFEKQIEDAKRELGIPFAKDRELSEKLQKQAQLTFELELGKPDDVIMDESTQEKDNEPIDKDSLLIGNSLKANMNDHEKEEGRLNMDLSTMFHRKYGFFEHETEKFIERFKDEVNGYLPDYRGNYPDNTDKDLIKGYIIPDMLENIYPELSKVEENHRELNSSDQVLESKEEYLTPTQSLDQWKRDITKMRGKNDSVGKNSINEHYEEPIR